MLVHTCEYTAHTQAHTLPDLAHPQSLTTLSGGVPLPHAHALLVPLSQLGGTSGGWPRLDSCTAPRPSPRAGCAEGHSGPGQRQLLKEIPGPCPGGVLLPVQALVKVAGPQLSPFPVKRQSQARPDRAGHAWEALCGIGSCRTTREPRVVGTEPAGERVSSANHTSTPSG